MDLFLNDRVNSLTNRARSFFEKVLTSTETTVGKAEGIGWVRSLTRPAWLTTGKQSLNSGTSSMVVGSATADRKSTQADSAP
jgi:hypothetical protein